MAASKKKSDKEKLNEKDSQIVKEDYGLKSENKVKVDVKGSQDITSKNGMFIPKHIIEKHKNETEDDEGLEVVIGVKKESKEEIKSENSDDYKLEVEIKNTEVLEEKQEFTENQNFSNEENIEIKEEALEDVFKVEQDIEIDIDDELLEENTEKNAETKETKKKEKKALAVQKDKSILKDEKPEYVKKMIEDKKRRMKNLIIISVVLIVIILFSTVFAIFK